MAVALLIDFFPVVQRKIPLVMTSIHVIIVNIFYRNCNSDSDSDKTGFWIYYPLICCLCFLWELFFIMKYYNKICTYVASKSRIRMALVSSVVSLSMFICVSYYIEIGRPFSCLFQYNHAVAAIIFCIGIMFLVSFSVYEHYSWGVYKSILPVSVFISDEYVDPSNILSLNTTEVSPQLHALLDDRELSGSKSDTYSNSYYDTETGDRFPILTTAD
jgi:hypothetical protein